MSHWENSDFRSTVSIIPPTTFFEDDDIQEEEDGVQEPPEMKFVPVPVKTEILEEDDGEIDVDPFMNTSLNTAACGTTIGDDVDNGAMRGVGTGRQRSTRRSSKRFNLTVEDGADGDDDDNDYDPSKEDDEEDWGASRKQGSGGGRKSKGIKTQPSKISTKPTKKATRPPPMTREERRERDKERKRLARQQEKYMRGEVGGDEVKRELESDSEQDDVDYEADKVKKIRRSTPRGKSASSTEGGNRRKRISEMTDEEKEIVRAKWKAQREQRRSRLTPQEKECRKERERVRKRSLKDNLNEEERRRVEEQYRKDRERKRARRAALTPEQKREEAQRVQLYRIARRARMSEDELKMKKIEGYLQYSARQASLTPEELQRRKEKRQEAARKRWEKVKQTPGEQERITQLNKVYRHNMPPDKRQKHLEKMRENYRKWLEEAKKDPQKLEQMKQQWKENKRKRKQMIKELGEDCVRKRKPYTKSVQDQIKKRRLDGGLCMTEEEKKEKQRLYLKRSKIRHKLKIQKMLESGMTMEMIQEQSETPEKREQRLIKNRLKKQRWLLRTKLRACGTDVEEIERRVKEMEATFQPPVTFKPYKPLPAKWKPVDARDLEVVGKDWVEQELKSIVATPKTNTNNLIPTPETNILNPIQKIITPIPTTVIKLSSSPAKSPIFKEATTATPSTSRPPPLQRATTNRVSAPINSKNYQQNQQVSSHPSVLAFAPPGGGVVVNPTQYLQNINQSPVSQYSRQTSTSIYPHQQPQSQPLNDHTHFLQNIMDGIKHQETESVISSTCTTPMTSHQIPPYQYAANSHHHENYIGSYGVDGERNNYGSPTNSPSGVDHEDYSSSSSYYNHYQHQLQLNPTIFPSASSFQVTQKTKKRRNRKPTEYTPRPGAKRRTKRSEVIRDVVCDLCGQSFNRCYFREHQRYYHNPHFDIKTRSCRICNQMFKLPSKWYSHYLRDHVNPTKEPEVKAEMCALCGKTFKSKENFQKHYHFTHGEGSKKENYKSCPVCPGERLFKEISALQMHIRRSHPGYKYVTGEHQCSRCDEGFINEKELREHVKTSHPQNYFPCGYCNVVRFTQLALNFHYDRCPKVSKEVREEKLTSWGKDKGVYSMQRVQIRCQFCDKAVTMSSLTRHYKEVHGVKEDKKFVCLHCPKEFVQRRFLAVHLEEVHSDPVEEMCSFLMQARTDNLKDLVMQQPKKTWSRRKIVPDRGGKGKKAGEGSLVEREDEEKTSSGAGIKGKRCRRNILVICEEDEISC